MERAFLLKNEGDSPKTVLDISVNSNDPEVKCKVTTNVVIGNNKNLTYQLIVYFSDWRCLKAVTWFLRLKSTLLQQISLKRQSTDTVASNMKGANQNCSTQAQVGRITIPPWNCILTVDELLEAEVAIICYCQQLRFHEEVTAKSSSRATVIRQVSHI